MPSTGEKVYLLERRYAFVLGLLVSFVVIFGVAWLIAYQSYTKAIEGTIRSNETRATLLSKLILEHQRAAIGVLRSYADRPFLVDAVKRRDSEEVLKHLMDLAKNNPEMDWPFISNPDSTVWVNCPVDRQVLNKDLSHRDWYKGVSREWKPYISSVYKLIVGEKDLAVAVSTPVFDEQGKVIGILATAQSTVFFRKIIEEVGFNLGAKITLIDQEGHIIYSSRFPYTKEVIDYPPLGFVEKAMKGGKGDVEVRDASDGDGLRYVSFAPVQGIGWSVIVEKARSEVLRSETSYLAAIGVFALLVYCFAVLSLVYFRERHRQIRGLEKLNEELDGRVRERTAEIQSRNKALLESEERYRSATQASNVAVWDLNLITGTVHWNETYATSFGRPPETANSWQWWIDRIHPGDRDRAAGGLRAAIDGEANNWVCEYRFLRADGTWADIYDRAYIARDKALKAWRVVGAMQDLTERKRAEEEAQKRLMEIEDLYSNAPVGLCVLDRELRWVRINERLAEINGIPAAAHIGKRVRDLLPELADAVEPEMHRILETGQPRLNIEIVSETPAQPGVMRSWLQQWLPLKDADGLVVGLSIVVEETTQRKQAEEHLRQRTLELHHLTETLERRVKERTEELASLSSQLVSAQENERKRISYELHDNVWQTLLAIRSEIERLFSGQEDWAALQTQSKKVTAAILDTVGKIRSMQGDLWPYVLDDIGILATIDWYCREFKNKHPGLTIDNQIELGEHEIFSPVKIVMYRILQETLSNIAKHSQASRVTLRLLKRDHAIEFILEDNGIGFDPQEAIAKRTPWGGLGLLSIKARAELSGGSLALEPAKGKGTIVHAVWPL